MIEWIEQNLDQSKILEQLSKESGYPPWYCSVMFHDVTKMTLKSYVSGRRLARATQEIREFPESDYLVFSYPSFDYMKENADVMEAVEKLAWNFDPASMGYEWNEQACQDYQRHYPEKLGYQILRPVKKLTA